MLLNTETLRIVKSTLQTRYWWWQPQYGNITDCDNHDSETSLIAATMILTKVSRCPSTAQRRLWPALHARHAYITLHFGMAISVTGAVVGLQKNMLIQANVKMAISNKKIRACWVQFIQLSALEKLRAVWLVLDSFPARHISEGAAPCPYCLAPCPIYTAALPELAYNCCFFVFRQLMNGKMLADLCPCFHRSPTKLCPDFFSFVCWIVLRFWSFALWTVPNCLSDFVPGFWSFAR